MSAQFQNGMRDPYGMGLPDINDDTYGDTAKRPQVGWVAGGQAPTGGSGGLPVSPPSQTSGQFIQLPGPLGQAANSPPPPADSTTVAGWAPPSVQNNQPVLRDVARPELKTPSTASYVFDALAHGLRGRASGAIFGALAASGNRQRDLNANAVRQYDEERQNAQAKFQSQVATRPSFQHENITNPDGSPGIFTFDPHGSREQATPPPGSGGFRPYAGASVLQQYHEWQKTPGNEAKTLGDFQYEMSSAKKGGTVDATPAKEPRQPTDYERYASEKRSAGEKPSWSDYVRSKSGASTEGRVDATPPKSAKPTDREIARKGFLARGQLTSLKKFDDANNASDQAASQAASLAKGGPLAGGPGSPGHGPLNAQSGQAPAQSGQGQPAPDGTVIDTPQGRQIKHGGQWVPVQ